MLASKAPLLLEHEEVRALLEEILLVVDNNYIEEDAADKGFAVVSEITFDDDDDVVVVESMLVEQEGVVVVVVWRAVAMKSQGIVDVADKGEDVDDDAGARLHGKGFAADGVIQAAAVDVYISAYCILPASFATPRFLKLLGPREFLI